MSNPLELLSLFVVIFMANSMILWNYLESEENPLYKKIFHKDNFFRIPIICSWEIMLIEDIIALKLFPYYLPLKFAIRKESQSSEETMKVDKLLKFMVSMTNAKENMEMLTAGNTSLIFLTTCH